jgi:hypothetical protein
MRHTLAGAALSALFVVGCTDAYGGPLTMASESAISPAPATPPARLAQPMRWISMARVERRLSTAAAYAEGTAVIGYAPGTSPSALAHDLGVAVISLIHGLNAMHVAASPARLAHIATRLDLRIRYVEPLEQRQFEHQRNDPFTYQFNPNTQRPAEWAFTHLGVDRALNLTAGSSDILVGYVDSGFSNIAELQGKIAGSWYFTSQGGDAVDTNGHGTFVASLIGAPVDDGLGLAGYCGRCRLVAFKDVRLLPITIATAIKKLTDEHVRIINLSLGGDSLSFVEADALQYAINAGVLVVASAGNDGRSEVSYPAAYLQPPNGKLGYGLAVGASDVNDARASFSNYGERLSLVAPGTTSGYCDTGLIGAVSPTATEFDGRTCSPPFADVAGNRYAISSGTSYSSPEVAGIAALVWAANPSLKNYEVADVLERTATRTGGWTAEVGWGVVNAAAALESVAGRSSADSVSLTSAMVTGELVAGGRVQATANATWADGVPIAAGTASCTVRIAGVPITTEEGFASAVAACSWRIPVSAAGKAGSGILSVQDATGVEATRAFSFTVRPAALTKKPKPKSKKKK